MKKFTRILMRTLDLLLNNFPVPKPPFSPETRRFISQRNFGYALSRIAGYGRKSSFLAFKLTKGAGLVFLFGLLVVPVLVISGANAQTSLDPCFDDSGGNIQGCLDAGSKSTDPNAPGVDNASTRVSDIIKLVINVFSLVVGVVAVIMIIIGGLKYITSGGDSGNVTSAKNTILYAIIGLVIVALAQIIVRFVLAQATDTPAATTP